VLAVIGVGALVAAGCGGDDDETPTAALSKQEFITQADAICTKGDQKLDRAGSEAFGKERPSKQEVEQGDEEQVSAFLDSAQRALDEVEQDIKGWIRPQPPARERVPIYTAAVREGMARMAGDVADGLIGHPICSMRWLDEVVIANFERGLSRSGRERREFDFIPTVCCAIDDDEGAAYDAARRTIAFYATVRTYKPLWEMHGFGGAAAAVGDAFRSGDLASMPGHVSDELVDAYCAAGPLDKVRARVEEVAGRADGLFLSPPTYFVPPEQLLAFQARIVEAFAPAGAAA
jgi:alkanesulfonate monooxygenase SsuD/methylene tetrahydromethanopterin reductase-like flavin-dependent oxidoreductase (luciferase family)